MCDNGACELDDWSLDWMDTETDCRWVGTQEGSSLTVTVTGPDCATSTTVPVPAVTMSSIPSSSCSSECCPSVASPVPAGEIPDSAWQFTGYGDDHDCWANEPNACVGSGADYIWHFTYGENECWTDTGDPAWALMQLGYMFSENPLGCKAVTSILGKVPAGTEGTIYLQDHGGTAECWSQLYLAPTPTITQYPCFLCGTYVVEATAAGTEKPFQLFFHNPKAQSVTITYLTGVNSAGWPGYGIPIHLTQQDHWVSDESFISLGALPGFDSSMPTGQTTPDPVYLYALGKSVTYDLPYGDIYIMVADSGTEDNTGTPTFWITTNGCAAPDVYHIYQSYYDCYTETWSAVSVVDFTLTDQEYSLDTWFDASGGYGGVWYYCTKSTAVPDVPSTAPTTYHYWSCEYNCETLEWGVPYQMGCDIMGPAMDWMVYGTSAWCIVQGDDTPSAPTEIPTC